MQKVCQPVHKAGILLPSQFHRRPLVQHPDRLIRQVLDDPLHRVRPVAAIYLTALTLDQKLITGLLQGDDPAWGEFAANAIVKREIPDGFPLKHAFAEGFPYQLFLSDRERWKPAAR